MKENNEVFYEITSKGKMYIAFFEILNDKTIVKEEKEFIELFEKFYARYINLLEKDKRRNN